MSDWLRLKGGSLSASPASRTPSVTLSARSEICRPTAAPAIASAIASAPTAPSSTVAAAAPAEKRWRLSQRAGGPRTVLSSSAMMIGSTTMRRYANT